MQRDLDKLFDVRVVERNITLGTVTRAEYDAHLASLEDCADKGETLSANLVFTRGRIDVGGESDDDAQG